MNRTIFFDHVRAKPFGGHLSQSQVDGMSSILDAFDKWASQDQRFRAYMLATAFHETAQTMQPIEEYRHGRGHAYGVPTGPWHQIYDGRGLVQITWERNYAHATLELRKHGVIDDGIDLEKTPELALHPDIAAAILIFGSQEGWFTGKKLSDYFGDGFSDWVAARRIINGLDRAHEIAMYAFDFNSALEAAA
jgi:hypothetical protein